MKFEYDPIKSQGNKAKHGIDFEEAQTLWSDPFVITAEAKSDSEPRLLVVGRIGGVFWTAVITHRGDAIRIISVRRSHKIEEVNYGKINYS